MSKNGNLHNAKTQKNDEFYTQYEDIQKELNHYEKHFKCKVVLCNCDDPFESNFAMFFLRNFNYLGLKRLICTSYSGSPFAGAQLTFFDLTGEETAQGHGYVLDVSSVPMKNNRGVSDENIDKLLRSKKAVKELRGNGDFRSPECIKYLEQADIVVTNPPFSLFREYVATLMEHNKKFIIWSNNNAITYKEFFPYLKDNKIWLGYTANKTCMFAIPDSYEKWDEKETASRNDGRKYGKVPAISVFTNLDIQKRHEDITLYKTYNEEEYPHYDNYDAINVDKVSDIPMDYDGVMGVPITFFDKYNSEQFEIIDCTHTTNPNLLSNKHDLSYYKDFKRGKVVTNADASMPLIEKDIGGGTKCVRQSDGKVIYQLYHRLFIRRKH